MNHNYYGSFVYAIGQQFYSQVPCINSVYTCSMKHYCHLSSFHKLSPFRSLQVPIISELISKRLIESNEKQGTCTYIILYIHCINI